MTLNVSRVMNTSQAYAASEALDLLSRLGIGQIDQLAELVRMDDVQCLNEGKLEHSSPVKCQITDGIVQHAERLFDYPYGASYGIGHQYVSEVAHHSWELKKVLDKALAMHRDPDPKFRGVNYDGVTVKYTKEPTPEAEVSGGSDSAVVKIRMTPKQLSALNQAIDLKVRIISGDFQAVTELAKSGVLIPFDKKDFFGKPVHDGRPKATPEQLSAFSDVMGALATTLGYERPIDLKAFELPRRSMATLEAQAIVKGETQKAPREPML